MSTRNSPHTSECTLCPWRVHGPSYAEVHQAAVTHVLNAHPPAPAPIPPPAPWWRHPYVLFTTARSWLFVAGFGWGVAMSIVPQVPFLALVLSVAFTAAAWVITGQWWPHIRGGTP